MTASLASPRQGASADPEDAKGIVRQTFRTTLKRWTFKHGCLAIFRSYDRSAARSEIGVEQLEYQEGLLPDRKGARVRDRHRWSSERNGAAAT